MFHAVGMVICPDPVGTRFTRLDGAGDSPKKQVTVAVAGIPALHKAGLGPGTREGSLDPPGPDMYNIIIYIYIYNKIPYTFNTHYYLFIFQQTFELQLFFSFF